VREFRLVLALWLSVAPAAFGQPAPLRMAVVAPDPAHPAWVAAERFAAQAEAGGVAVQVRRAPLSADGEAEAELYLMPLRSLAARVPALEVLELPFHYDDLPALHGALDGRLGALLRTEARRAGWEILAFWDQGLHVLSGQPRYDGARRLAGKEFILLRPDPVAQRQFTAWRADTRQVRPRDLDELVRECLAGSRAATMQELWRERVDRAHLSITLTRHRYEGWLVAAPAPPWRDLHEAVREQLARAAAQITPWQREQAANGEAAALARLREQGMYVHDLDAGERATFVARLPPPDRLISDTVAQPLKQALLAAASAGAADVGAAPGAEGGGDAPARP
jgi:TRAP-type C4-dicarboxylate transport system substrate-binding protein